MPQETNLNVSPYFDDFDSSKNFYKVLFKPGYPIQARELTTSQSILQNQIEQFGNHIFKEGSVVIPGQVNYNNQFYSVKIETEYSGVPVSFYLQDLIGRTIKSDISKIRAKIIHVLDVNESDNEYVTLFVSYLGSGISGESVFLDGETLTLEETLVKENLTIQSGSGFSNTLSSNSTSVGSAVILSEGVYFIRGTFVNVAPQILILDSYSNTPSYQVGFTIIEEIVNSDEDSSLNDNSQGFSNYAAPGADRLKITAILSKKELNNNNNENFINLLEVRDGVLISTKSKPQYSIFQEELSRRTSEESGDYYVRPFTISSKESLNNKIGNSGIFKESQLTYNGNVPSESLGVYKISPGKAYVKGHEVEILSTVFLDFEKPRTTRTLEGQEVNYLTGSTYTLNRVYGAPNLNLGSPFIVSLRDRRVGVSQTIGSGKEIGLARVYDFSLESGSYNSEIPDTNEWDLSLFDVQLYTEITLNEPITLTTPVHIKGKSSGATGYLRYDSNNSGIITAYNVNGKFSNGEKFIFNGLETESRISTNIVEYTNKDVQSISHLDSSDVIFTGDIKPVVSNLIGFAGITSSFSGISTVRINVDSDFNFINLLKVGNIVGYTKPGDNIRTFSEVVSVSSNTLTISGVSTVTGVCEGSLPNTDIEVNNLSILKSEFQPSPDNTLYTILPRPFISSVDLENSDIIIRKQFSVSLTLGQSNTIIAESNETFLSFDEERYILIRSDGTFEPLSPEKFIFANGSKELTLIGLNPITDLNCRLIATLRKINIKSKIKNKNRIKSIVFNRSKYEYSGIGTTTINDGLSYNSSFYGTRVQDEEICLLSPDVTKIYGVYESNGIEDPILPSIILTSTTNTTSDLLIGEEFFGVDSGAVGIYVSRKNDNQIEFSYLNDKVFKKDENVRFKESGVQASVQTILSGDKNILNNYKFDYGQRDTIYDYSKLIRIPEVKEPTRKLRVIYETASYSSSDDGDLTTINSYSQFDYCTITFAKQNVNNGDIIDIRPRVVETTQSDLLRSPFEFLGRVFSSSGNSSKNILASDESISLTYSYYLPRIDRIFLTKDGIFQLNKGEPSEIPQQPQSLTDALEIANISLPPYLCDASKVTINLLKHKRYQMKDIGKLEDRIKNLESYTTLNLLEINTENLKIKDANGLDRFKSGFFVDNFTSTNTQNKSTIVKNSIDTSNGELRPSPFTTEIDLVLGSSSLVGIGTSADPNADSKFVTDLIGNNIRRTGQLITLDYNDVVLVKQPFATRVENVTPFLVTRYNGTIELNPSSDTWVDQVRIDAKQVEIDNFTATQQQLIAEGWDPQTGYSPITWGAWETTWTGSTTTYNTYWNYWNYSYYGRYGYPYYYGWYNYPYYYDYWGHYYGWYGYGYPYYYYNYPWYWYGGWGWPGVVETTTKTGTSTREGTQFKLTEQLDVQSLGDSVVSTDFISYMRSRNVEFIGRRFKPFTQVYAFFDGEDVNSFITPKLLEINMNSGVFEVGETVIGFMPNSSTLENSTSGIIPKQFSFRVAKANHRYGPYNVPDDIFILNPYNSESTTPLPSDYSSTTEILNIDTYSLSEQVQGDFYGNAQVGMILRGQKSGAEATVTNLRLYTDNVGTVIGSFFIPNPNVPTNPTFETGIKNFRLTSSSTNSQISGVTDTSADQDYYAQGTLNTIQETIVSTRTPKIESEKLVETKEVSETTTSVYSPYSGWYGWPYSWRYPYGKWGYCHWDPLAQSFRVDEEGGIFVTKIDLFFKTKDKELPIAVQLRSVTNGIPTTEVYPFSEVFVEPKDIVISDDGSAPTTITFPSPVYLKSGQEHAIVILSESNEYNVWISRLGEVDITTQSQPESQQVIVTQQPLLGSLFKSQNGSTWDPSQYEDLKFTLYKAKFTTNSGDINFYNPDLNFGNKQIANLLPNSLNLNSRKLKIRLDGIITDSNFKLGNTILQQDSNGYGNCIEFAGSSSGNLNIINSGIGYQDGYYENVPLVNITGNGRNATANITIVNGEIVSLGATIFSGGSGYKIGDVLTIGEPLSNSGRNARLSISQVNGINEIILDNVQGEFVVGNNKQIQYVGTSGTINLIGSSGNLYIDSLDVYSEEYDGLHIKVNHRNHGMHSKTNLVKIEGVYPDSSPISLSSNYDNTSSNSIALVGTDEEINQIFGKFENIEVSTQNPGYILIDQEIISYEGLLGNTLIGITRGIDQTKPFSYPEGTAIFKYELNGISLRRINTIHNLQDTSSNIKESVDLDHYYIKIDMSSSNKGPISVNGANGQADRSSGVSYPKLYINSTKSSGGFNILATQNIPYEIVRPIVQTMDLTNTSLTARIRSVSGTSIGGNEESFVDKGFEPISLKENTYLSSPRIVSSKINETSRLNILPGNKSFTLNLVLNTSDENISPVIDLDRVGMIFTSNRINNTIKDYITDFRISTLKDDPSSFVYATNPISLTVPASSIKVILSAYVNRFSDIRALYSVMKEYNEESIYYPFPGFNNLIKSGQVIDISQSDGTSDIQIQKSDGIGFLSDELSYRDYEFTIDNLPDFRFFSIKLIGSSTNQAHPPRIKALRVISLA